LTLTAFTVPSLPGNERLAMVRVAEAVEPLGLSTLRQDQLLTAVGEAVLNAIEHGNDARAELPAGVKVTLSGCALVVRVTDQGKGGAVIRHSTPDLYAKLAGEETPRGWGLFLIEHMVDELRVNNDECGHTVELVLYLQTEPHRGIQPQATAVGGENDTE
jgi:anti-sigma regulatory factor (Ser/Thr protein kinase)